MMLSGLHIYPVKSGRVINMESADVAFLGLQNDRRWVVVEAATAEDGKSINRFISQRSHPQLAQLMAVPTNGVLRLSYGAAHFDLDIKTSTTDQTVSVWRDDFPAALYEGPVNDWLSKQLGGAFRLASFGSKTQRRRKSFMRDAAFDVSFADGYPILIATQASLGTVNAYVTAKGEAALPMSRFRPNIVIDGASSAWAEDNWKHIKIGDVIFDCVKPCTRCVMTTLDPISGESRGNMSLQALQHLRSSADNRLKGVLFGVNAIPLNEGRIKHGDKVQVLETQTPWKITPRAIA